MNYQQNLFEIREYDNTPFEGTGLNTGSIKFLGLILSKIQQQNDLINQLSLSADGEETLDRLYRNNHVLAGMARIYGIHKLDHLLDIIDFALDLARQLKTMEKHSVDYLVKLFYEKIGLMTTDLIERGKIDLDIADFVEEGRNYLSQPLNDWNKRLEDSRLVFQTIPLHDDVSSSLETPQQVEDHAPTEGVVNAAQPIAHTVEIPFNDEPEPLNVPLDKVGMISDFYEENTEILNNFANLLVDLESAENSKDLVNDLFRMIHTVKGGARLLNIKKLECLAHTMENVLDLIRQDKIPISADAIDLLLDAKNGLSEMMEETASRGPFATRVRPYVEKLLALINNTQVNSTRVENRVASSAPIAELSRLPEILRQPPNSSTLAAAIEKDKRKNAESLRVSSEKLDEVLNTASEIFIGRIRFQNEISAIENFIKSFKSTLNRAAELHQTRILAKLDMYIPEFAKELKRISAPTRNQGRLPENRLADLLTQMVSRLLPDNSDTEMSLQEELNLNYLTIEEIQKQLQKNLETLEQLSTRLQNGAMSFRMVPISNLFERFPLQLRDLARTIGKKIRVEIVGGDTELDKVLINKLADPLLHMLRNSIDHGIEFPAERIKLGKPESGTITLKTYYHGSYAVIEIRDDGKGMDLQRIYAKALEKELIPENKQGKMTDSEILDLIFLPGFSTNDQVTELSGRGVGMDVVKTAINQLHGIVETDTTLGQGTQFKIKLPLTLAIVKILLVQESSFQFALPILNIEALITVKRNEINRIENRLIYNYQGQTIPVASLSTILDFPQSHFHSDNIQMVVLNENNRMTGILVDSVLGRQEILIKSLGRFLKKAPFVMGCTILRDSRLVLILDPRQIVEAVKQNGAMKLARLSEVETTTHKRHTILIVDDSAIQRENLKTILKNADYIVDTAENGFDALKGCRNKVYSAFCVDILMPLMDGYEFVERLRKISIYQNVPIFLITAKDVDEARISNLNISQVFKKPVESAELISIMNNELTEKVHV